MRPTSRPSLPSSLAAYGDTFQTSGARYTWFSANLAGDPKVTTVGANTTWGSHMPDAAAAGVTAVLFGAGDWRARTEDRARPPRVRAGDVLVFPGGLDAEVESVADVAERLVDLRFTATGDRFWSSLYRHGRPVQYSYIAAPLALWHVQTPFSSAAVNSTRASGGRVIAVGTSVVRALESAAARTNGPLAAASGETELLVDGAHALRAVDALFTGMHDPGTSHDALVHAFAPEGLLRRAHADATARGFLGHELGDSMLIARRS